MSRRHVPVGDIFPAKLQVTAHIGMKAWNHLIFYIPSCSPLPPRHFADCFSGRNTAAVPFGTNSPLGGKIKVYLSNTLLSMLAALCFIAAGALGGLLFQVISGEEFHLETVELVQAFACSLGVGIASASLCTLLAMLISSRSIGVVIGFCSCLYSLFCTLCQHLLRTAGNNSPNQKNRNCDNGMTVYGEK